MKDGTRSRELGREKNNFSRRFVTVSRKNYVDSLFYFCIYFRSFPLIRNLVMYIGRKTHWFGMQSVCSSFSAFVFFCLHLLAYSVRLRYMLIIFRLRKYLTWKYTHTIKSHTFTNTYYTNVPCTCTLTILLTSLFII